MSGFKGIDWHRWSWEKIQSEFPHTHLDLQRLDQSRGLNKNFIEEIRKVSGLNRLTP